MNASQERGRAKGVRRSANGGARYRLTLKMDRGDFENLLLQAKYLSGGGVYLLHSADELRGVACREAGRRKL